MAAAIQAGFPFSEDCNGEEIFGVGYTDWMNNGGKRHSTVAAFLSLVRNRQYLIVVTCALVTRLTFDRDRCLGVEFKTDNGLQTSAADREVVLSSGVIPIGGAQVPMLPALCSEIFERNSAAEKRFSRVPAVLEMRQWALGP